MEENITRKLTPVDSPDIGREDGAQRLCHPGQLINPIEQLKTTVATVPGNGRKR